MCSSDLALRNAERGVGSQVVTSHREVGTRVRIDLETAMARAQKRQTYPVPAIPGAHLESAHGCLTYLHLAFAQAERDESVRRVIRRDAHLDSVTWNHPDAEAAHATRKLRRHDLPALEHNPVTTTAENFLDGADSLDQIVSRQRVSR